MIVEKNMIKVVENEHIQIFRLELGPFGTNSYILICPKTKESVLVDAPGEATLVLERLKETQPKYILMTHGHFDHIGGLAELKSALNIPVAAHLSEAGDLPVTVDLELNHGDEISLGRIKLKVLHTPGHTVGSICFIAGNYLIAGDTLFPGGPGRTQTPDDFRQIVKSITEKLFGLPDDTEVYPGHGEATTIGREKKLFELFSSLPLDPNLCGDVVWTS
jgi:glyoxylase-like metal-dependent hydrolase (beta-lactamase superfamily II)